jgi:hypothetical protein
MFLLSFELIAATALLSFGVINTITINRGYSELLENQADGYSGKEFQPVYTLSATGKNVVIIMLDRALSGFVPHIFSEKPELHAVWSGFTWYPNCVSFAGWTLYGVPALMGGYEYTPLEMQRADSKPLVEKHNEALLLLPLLFTRAGFHAAITDPAYANYGFSPDLRIFEPYSGIHAENIRASYAGRWMKNHPEVTVISVADLLKQRLLRFSFFKTAVFASRLFIYDRGDWLTVNDRDMKESNNELTVGMISNYAALDYLPEITAVSADVPGNLAIMFNELTHDTVFLQMPGYVPASAITGKGSGIFAENPYYHVNMAAFTLLGKWFDYLKSRQVYDNTRIIIISDHGFDVETSPGSFRLSDGRPVEKYISLLMVKDFNAEGGLAVDRRFMTQADVPLLASRGIIDNPVNPFTGKPLRPEKQDGATITTSSKFYPTHHGKNRFSIDEDEWLHVRDNIFDPGNWEKAEK